LLQIVFLGVNIKEPSIIPIDGKYLNQIHNKFLRNNVYDEINKQLLNRYLKAGKEHKLKYQCIDSSFIPNKGGSVKNNNHLLNDDVKANNLIVHEANKHVDKKCKEETFIDYNRYNGRKKYFKISTITDSFGTPLTSTPKGELYLLNNLIILV